MGQETSKSKDLRQITGDFKRYLVGSGIDIGCGPDVLKVESGSVRPYDKKHGDAQTMSNVPDEKYDFVYSSHCLEHMHDVRGALRQWVRVLRRNGFLYFTVPCFRHYEKGHWPSKFNKGHHASFALHKRLDRKSHYSITHDIVPYLRGLGVETLEVRFDNLSYNYLLPESVDQTNARKKSPPALCQICVIGRKN